MKTTMSVAGAMLIILGTAVIIFYSCRKTDQPPTPSVEMDDASVASLAHIQAFKQRMEYYRDNRGIKTGGESYFATQAAEELESLINLDFCHTNVSCTEQAFETAQVIMPLNDIDKINDPDLMALYFDEIIGIIQGQMNSLTYESKQLLLVDLEYIGTNPDEDALISIGSLIGNNQLQLLHNGEWWYGENMGLCGTGQYAPEDAATQLALQVRNTLLPAPPAGGRWVYTGITNTYINPTQDPLTNNPDNYLDYKIFYATEAVGTIDYEVQCLSLYEMGFYENHYIAYAIDFENATGKDFYNCIAEGLAYPDSEYHIQHNYWVYVGHRFLVIDMEVENILEY